MNELLNFLWLNYLKWDFDRLDEITIALRVLDNWFERNLAQNFTITFSACQLQRPE